MFSLVWLFVTPWTVVHQAPLFMKFSRQEYWSGCDFLLQGTRLTQGSNTHLFHFLHWRQILYHWATWVYQTTLSVSWEIFFRVKEQQLEPDMPVQVWCTILDAWGWCTGTTQRDGMGREEGGGFRMGNTCIPVVDSFWYLAKLIQLCKV